MALILISALLGAILFAAAEAGWFTGVLAGALAACIYRLRVLERRVERLGVAERGIVAAPEAGARSPVAPAPSPPRAAAPAAAAPAAPTPASAPPARPTPAPGPAPAHTPGVPRYVPPPREPGPFDPAIAAVREYFTTGNLVARIGGVVLLFGLAFLLKYAAERDIVPIQLRLGGVWAGGLAMLGLGWRLRRRGVYGAILQGTGVGTLYLTTYVALKLYALVPAVPAFAVMVAVVALSGWLAVAQDSRALATLGALGGFLAPVLTSTGSGSHVVLFSYYAVLNLGIFGVAWRRAWRELNLLGFLFTFVIASLWGYRAYSPQYYATTQPFLAFHWGLYLAIPVLFALRRRRGGIGYLDGTLVFGVPAAGFVLQAAIAEDFPRGLTLSALAVAAVYLVAARALQARGGEALLPLQRSFTALGVAFTTLAVPLTFDGSWLAALWALEGAALVWVGVRQGGRLPRAAGLALQLAAAGALLDGVDATAGTPILNGLLFGTLTLSLAGMACAYFLARDTADAGLWRVASAGMLGWGVLWWLNAGVREIHTFVPEPHEPGVMVLFLAASAVALERAARWLDWSDGGFPALLLLPALALMVTATLEVPGHTSLFTPWGAAAWPLAAAAHLALLRWRERDWPRLLVQAWHAGGLLLALLLLGRESAWAVRSGLALHGAWPLVAWVAIPALALYLLTGARSSRWPLRSFRREYTVGALAAVALGLGGWALAVTFRADPAAPLRYLPLLHPLELAQAAVLVAVLRWWGRARREPPLDRLPGAAVPLTVGLLAFLALNGVLARAIHAFGGVPFTADALFTDRAFHAGLSILWSVLALGIMVAGSRRAVAPLWFGGSGLLGLVVLKLFLVELGGSGTVARIVSFVAVGLLMLLIGYVAPMPPRAPEAPPEPPLEPGLPPA